MATSTAVTVCGVRDFSADMGGRTYAQRAGIENICFIGYRGSRERSSLVTDWQRRLLEASGYLDLGMLEDCAVALDRIPTADKAHPEVLHLRVSLHIAQKAWNPGMELARHLVTVQPDDAWSWIRLAYCTRRAESVENAEEILLRAQAAHPEEAMIRYNLACYACVSGKMDTAVERLREAIILHEGIRQLAVEDEDLRPLWGMVEELS